jgi:hypothetical protein
VERPLLAAALAVAHVLAAFPAGAEADWAPFADASVVRIVTHDEDGAVRDTPVWLVAVDGDAFVRTNDSRWLANIRRGSDVELRLEEAARPVAAEEVGDAATRDRVEEAFKAKYGLLQRVMSALRVREPTVLRLRDRGP